MLDLRTALISNVILFTLCTVLAVMLWYQSRGRFVGIGFLAADFALQATGIVLLALRGVVPDLLSIAAANVLTLLGSILGFVGLEYFVGKRRSQAFNTLLLAVFAGLFYYYTTFDSVVAVRTLTSAVGHLIIWAQCAWLLLARVDRPLPPSTRTVVIAFVGLFVTNLIRIAEILIVRETSTDYLSSGPFEVVSMLTVGVLAVALMLSLVLMVNKRLASELLAREQTLATAFRASPAAIVLSRLADGRILEVNEGFCEITGYSREEVIGRSTLDLGLWAETGERGPLVEALKQGRGIRDREERFRTREGAIITCMLSTGPVTIDGELCALSSVIDISERKRMEEEIRDLSLRDPLTGLYNRRGFFTIAEQMIREADRSRARLHLVFLDVDELKHINDSLGHDAGDRALVASADVLRATFREADLIARVGGDEFAVCYLETERREPATVLARLEEHIVDARAASSDLPLDLSWGISTLEPLTIEALDAALAEADRRMYEQKIARRDDPGEGGGV